MRMMWWLVVSLAWGSTAALRVQVVDDEMELPIPGAQVVLQCDTLIGGARELTTDANGGLLIPDLASGTCTLQVSRPGFTTVTVQNIVVEVNRTRPVMVRLSNGSVEEVVVQKSRRRARDTQSTTRGQVLTKEFLDRVPSGRSYQHAVTLPAGATGQGSNPNMAGGATHENVASTETYTDHGVHDVELAAVDQLATFAVDVDTGAYARSRRWLQQQGVLPPPAGVRVEEFVNAFPYDYAPNTDADEPLAPRLEAAPHPWDPKKVLLRAALQGTQPPERTRPPAKLTFLVDVSGSMSRPDKLGLAVSSLHTLVDNLGPEDEVAIATYAGSTRVVLQPTYSTRAATIHAAIDTLTSGGGTAMSDGMTLAYEMADAMFLPGAENRVIVLSDGDANIGRSSHEGILEQLSAWAGKGITMSTIGFGTGNYQDTLMEQLANNGDGTYHYIDSEQEAEKVFGTHAAGTLQTIARDAKVQLELHDDAVLAWRQIGYENREIEDDEFDDDTVDGGEVGSGHQVTALFELTLRDDPGPVLATMHVRAKPPGPDAPSVAWEGSLRTADVHASWTDASDETRFALGVATFAELLRHSPHTEEVRWVDLEDLLGAAADPERDDHDELLELVRTAHHLDGRQARNR